MFTGEYRHTIDGKGRVAVPSRFRAQLDAGAFVSRWLDSCLAVFPRAAWDELAAKVAMLPTGNATAREFSRFLFGSAFEVELDRRKAVVFVHPLRNQAKNMPAYSYPAGMTELVLDTTRAIHNLLWNGTFGKFPNIKWIMPHGGGTIPFLIYRVSAMDNNPKVRANLPGGSVKSALRGLYYDVAEINDPAPLKALMEIADPSRILFGSDYPLITPDRWMADFAEWLPTDCTLHSGEDPLAQHNLYPLRWQRLNRDLFASVGDGVERVWFVRSGYLRSQPLVQVMWAGDQTTDWAVGDGFQSVIPMGIGLGMTGFPYYGSDIAGYASFGTEPTDKELFFRWVTLGALSPVMRTHHGKLAQSNWQWEHDAASEAHFLQWTRFHAALWPYLWQAAQEGLLRCSSIRWRSVPLSASPDAGSSGTFGGAAGAEDGARHFVTYAHFDGQPLASRIGRTGPMHINEARPVLKAILEALSALHDARLSHGNLKLENVLLVRGEHGGQRPGPWRFRPRSGRARAGGAGRRPGRRRAAGAAHA